MRVRARKCEEDGIKFDSLMERDRYRHLKLLQRAGTISKLQVHPEFVFVVNGVTVGKYKPDFTYLKDTGLKAADGPFMVPIVEDVKGFRKSKKTGRMLPRVDKGHRMRVRLMQACFGLAVEIV